MTDGVIINGNSCIFGVFNKDTPLIYIESLAKKKIKKRHNIINLDAENIELVKKMVITQISGYGWFDFKNYGYKSFVIASSFEESLNSLLRLNGYRIFESSSDHYNPNCPKMINNPIIIEFYE